MNAWVFLFSKFTDELIFLEGILIFSILGMYASYYILKRRKYGVAEKSIPSEVVRIYLSELTGDAENLRNELFGLLGQDSMEDPLQSAAPRTVTTADLHAAATGNAASGSLSNAEIDKQVQIKMKALEQKFTEQSKALETLLNEKMKLEEELAQTNSQLQNAGTATGAGATSSDSHDLLQKLQKLEAQLSEYAVIEEDLANLKKLQKENKSLRMQLEEINLAKGVSTGTSPVAAEAPAVTTPAPQLSPAPIEAPAVAAPVAAEAAPVSIQAEAIPATDFEKKVDAVEKQIAAATPEAATPATPPTPAAMLPPESSEAKLQEDFDKLLQSSGS